MIPQANLSFMWHSVIDPRIGTPYGWGASFDPNDVTVGTDCSGAVSAVIEALLNGPNMNWTRQFWTGTFSGLQPGDVGPFGLVCIPSPDSAPADAAAIVAIRQGPSAESSHMMVQVGGVNIEDGDGLVVGADAADIHDNQFNQWFYLPGPIEGAAPAPPLSKPDQYARMIIVEGQRRNISPRGIQIALAVALVESNLQNYANSNVPESLNIDHDAVGSDHDSLGLFQQRCPMWGDAATLMNPTLSAGLFYDALVKLAYNGPYSPGTFAQAVQGSAFPDRYDQRWDDAVALYTRLVTAPPTDEGDFMSALTPDEQRALFNEIMGRRPSRSPLRHVGEGAVGDVEDLMLNTDGSTHVLVVQALARLGDPDSLALLNEVAHMDPARNPDRVHDRQLAQAILNDLATRTTSVPPSGQTPGTIPATPVAVTYTPPAQVVYAQPVQTALPAAASTAEGGLLGEITSLTQKLHDVSTTVTAIVEGTP